MEQNRTPDVLPHHRELAGPAADQLPGRHRNHRRDDHPGRVDHRGRAGYRQLLPGRHRIGRRVPSPADHTQCVPRRLELRRGPPSSPSPGSAGDHPADRPRPDHDAQRSGPDRHARTDFERLAAASEPYWDALAEAAFQRRFHRPRSYLHPQTSSLDHYHRLLAALLRRRRAIPSTLLAQLLGVGRTNLSNQFQDGNRLLDLHRVVVTPLPGAPARTLEQIRARLSDEDHPADQL